MTDTKVKVNSQSKKADGTFGGVVFGIVLFVFASWLLYWNEGRYVATGDAISEAQAVRVDMPEPSRIDPAFNGKLVHTYGFADTTDRLTDSLGVNAVAISLERRVTYYQWIETSKTTTRKNPDGKDEDVTTYSYSRDWTNKPVDSYAFHEIRYQGSNFVLADVSTEKHKSRNVSFGAYMLPGFLIDSISGTVPTIINLSPEEISSLINRFFPKAPPAPVLTEIPTEAQVETTNITPRPGDISNFTSQDKTNRDLALLGYMAAAQDNSAPVPASASPESTPVLPAPTLPVVNPEPQPAVHISGNTIYLGVSPATPQIGDVKIEYYEIKPANISIIAKVIGNTFEPFRASNLATFSRLDMGTVSADNMFGDAISKNVTMTWIWRGVGALLAVWALKSIMSPLVLLASYVPVIGTLIAGGTGIAAFFIGVAWALGIIALAWLRFRPVIGIGILAAAGILIALLYRKGWKKKS